MRVDDQVLAARSGNLDLNRHRERTADVSFPKPRSSSRFPSAVKDESSQSETWQYLG